MEGEEQESLHQNFRVSNKVVASSSTTNGTTRNRLICEKPTRVIPGVTVKDHEYMCLIGLPLSKISITCLTWSHTLNMLILCILRSAVFNSQLAEQPKLCIKEVLLI